MMTGFVSPQLNSRLLAIFWLKYDLKDYEKIEEIVLKLCLGYFCIFICIISSICTTSHLQFHWILGTFSGRFCCRPEGWWSAWDSRWAGSTCKYWGWQSRSWESRRWPEGDGPGGGAAAVEASPAPVRLLLRAVEAGHREAQRQHHQHLNTT